MYTVHVRFHLLTFSLLFLNRLVNNSQSLPYFIHSMGKTKRGAVVTVKKRGIAGADKRSERIASKNAANKKQYGKPCNYESREERDFASMLESVGMYVKVMEGDGNCMFRSIADQLFGSLVGHIHIRMQVVDYMVKEKDNFSLFVEDDETFDDYISRMR